MHSIVLSALFAALNWLLRTVILKFLVFTVLYIVVTATINYLLTKNVFGTNPNAINDLFGNLGAELWYFINLLQVPAGLSMVISAYGTRFAIRRLPVVG